MEDIAGALQEALKSSKTCRKGLVCARKNCQEIHLTNLRYRERKVIGKKMKQTVVRKRIATNNNRDQQRLTQKMRAVNSAIGELSVSDQYAALRRLRLRLEDAAMDAPRELLITDLQEFIQPQKNAQKPQQASRDHGKISPHRQELIANNARLQRCFTCGGEGHWSRDC